MHDIFSRLQAMGKRVNVAIFFHGDISERWSILLEWYAEGRQPAYASSGTKLEIKRQGKDLEEVLRSAWDELERISTTGLGSGALGAPIDADALKLTLED
jgi:hypothetical protein